MWEALKSFYDIQGAIEIANAEAKLTAIIMGEAEDVSDYATRLQELHDRLRHLGEPVSPATQTINFLNSLNTRYSARVESVMSWAVCAPTLFTIPTNEAVFELYSLYYSLLASYHTLLLLDGLKVTRATQDYSNR